MWLNRHFIMEPKSGPAPPRVVKVQIIGWIMSLTRKLQVLVVIVEHCWLFQQLYWIMLGCVLLGGSRLTWSSTGWISPKLELKESNFQIKARSSWYTRHTPAQFMLFCVITADYVTWCWWHWNMTPELEMAQTCECWEERGWVSSVSCRGLLVIIWRHWAACCPVSRVLIITMLSALPTTLTIFIDIISHQSAGPGQSGLW